MPIILLILDTAHWKQVYLSRVRVFASTKDLEERIINWRPGHDFSISWLPVGYSVVWTDRKSCQLHSGCIAAAYLYSQYFKKYKSKVLMIEKIFLYFAARVLISFFRTFIKKDRTVFVIVYRVRNHGMYHHVFGLFLHLYFHQNLYSLEWVTVPTSIMLLSQNIPYSHYCVDIVDI